jgi:hypothetical protein
VGVEVGEALGAAFDGVRRPAAARQRRGDERKQHGAEDPTRHPGIHKTDGRSLL